ncbi:MAG: hypothetical protein ABIP44_10915 [Pseudoxanthomonas sp.]
MNKGILVFSIALSLALVACKKHETTPASEVATTDIPTPVTAVEPAATNAEPGKDDLARSEQQAKLDYATMEDGYINDAKGQWASAAKASSAFGSANEADADPQSGNTPWQATAAPNGKEWTNNNQDIGFDSIELDYAKPVTATEVRVVTNDNEAAESINKIELIDTDGTAHTVWSGLSETKQDTRGARTWIVHKFDATPYQVKSVKLTFANNVASGYKKVDAVQLIGE